MSPNDTTELELNDDAAERALMGAVAFYPDACAGVLAGLDPDAFYDPHRAAVWDVCRDLSAENAPLTPGHIMKALTTSGRWNAATQRVVQRDMLDAKPAHQAPAHADLVATLAARRKLIQKAVYVRQIAGEDHYEPSELLARMRAVFDEEPVARAEGEPLRWRELVAEFEREHTPDADRNVIPIQWGAVEDLLGGLFGGRMYVLGGRPGQGKSTAALVLAAYAANCGHETLIISREMPSVDVTGRLLARGAQVNLRDINARQMTTAAREKVSAYAAEVGDLPLTVDANPRGLAGIKSLARAHKHRHGLDLLVVDYLQLIHTDQPGRTREQEVAQVSMQLKRLALELDCAVVLPAQLNRASLTRADSRPTMADLRDSGQIEQDADVVILLHREKTPDGNYTGTISFIVDKNRHGPTAEIGLDWLGGYGEIA